MVNGSPDLSLPSTFASFPGSFAPPTPFTSDIQSTIPAMSHYGSSYLAADVLPPSLSPATALRASPLNEPTEPLISYYFEHIRKLQFAFAGPELSQTLYLVSNHPSKPSFPLSTLHSINNLPREVGCCTGCPSR